MSLCLSSLVQISKVPEFQSLLRVDYDGPIEVLSLVGQLVDGFFWSMSYGMKQGLRGLVLFLWRGLDYLSHNSSGRFSREPQDR